MAYINHTLRLIKFYSSTTSQCSTTPLSAFQSQHRKEIMQYLSSHVWLISFNKIAVHLSCLWWVSQREELLSFRCWAMLHCTVFSSEFFRSVPLSICILGIVSGTTMDLGGAELLQRQHRSVIAGPYTTAVFNHSGPCHPALCNGLPSDIPTCCFKARVATLAFKRWLSYQLDLP